MTPGTPGTPEYEARMQADIARLQAAKGVSPRAWIRENKTLLLVFVGYLALVSVWGFVAYANGDPPGGGLLMGIFLTPIVGLRVYLKFRRIR